jgi:hypothetical protein
MNLVQSQFIKIVDLIEFLKQFLHEIYFYEEKNIEKKISNYIKNLRDDLYVYVEYPYIDRVYRDSYYNYYSKKLANYDRDCVRLSLFKKKYDINNFRNLKNTTNIERSYLGFIIIRPTLPNLIGRTVINPEALINRNFSFCYTKVNSMVNGVKLNVEGFPHSTQDAETISCAETTILGVMEYFGNKYSEYCPVLPSEIINALSNYSYERQVPSKGLTLIQISIALKKFGFGVKVYSPRNLDFYNIISYYVDSGIPIIATLKNNSIAHAVIIVGHDEPKPKKINSIKIKDNSEIKVYDFADLEKNYVLIDDNYPPYQKAQLLNPTSYYSEQKFKNCKLTSIIVPLYPKIHLEASLARKLILKILTYKDTSWEKKYSKEIIFRLFIASSRSFKEKIAKNISIESDLKNLLIKIVMPKFIWVAEIYDKNDLLTRKVKGMILLDATDASYNISNAIIIIVYPDKIQYFRKGELKGNKINLNKFDNFSNNLKEVN